MTTPLITTLQESIGYLKDAGFHQTARLMILAAAEIENLNRRIRELEEELEILPDVDREPSPAGPGRRRGHLAVVSSRREA